MLNTARKAALAVTLAFVGSGLTAAAQERREAPPYMMFGSPEEGEQADAVQQLFEAYKTAWKHQDVDQLMSLHAEDVEWINAYARMFRGAEPLGEFLEARLFPAFAKETSVREAASMRLISIRYLGEDAAVIHAFMDSERGVSRNADEELRRVHLHLVLERNDEARWLVVHTAIMDAR